MESTPEHQDSHQQTSGEAIVKATHENDRNFEWHSSEKSNDIALNIPKLKAEELELKAGEVEAKVDLELSGISLVKVKLGINAKLKDVCLNVKGLEAEVHLNTDLAAGDNDKDKVQYNIGINRVT
jgi:hypothetical protein